MNGFQCRESNYFLVPVFICPKLHICCSQIIDLNDNLSCEENYNLSQRSLIMLGCLRPLCELRLYVTTTLVQTWRSLCSTSPLFSKGRITASKEVKNIISRGLWRVLVMPMGRLSVLSTPVAGRVTSHTCSLSHCVFSKAFN